MNERAKPCTECGRRLGDNPGCPTCSMYSQDQEGREEDSAIQEHYESGRWLEEPMP